MKQETVLSSPFSLQTQQGVRRRRQQLLVLVGGCLILLCVLSLLLGRYPVWGLMTPHQLLTDDMAQRLVLHLRLPRIITAVLLGMTLASAGLTFQTIFANPLVEPGFLGVSQGAAFGAACCIVFWKSSLWLVQGLAMVFALAGLGATYLLACRIRYGGWVLRLVLAGIAVSAMFSAGLGCSNTLPTLCVNCLKSRFGFWEDWPGSPGRERFPYFPWFLEDWRCSWRCAGG